MNDIDIKEDEVGVVEEEINLDEDFELAKKAKKKKKEQEEETSTPIEEKKEEKVIPRYSIDTFIEESVEVRKRRTSGNAFKTWYQVMQEKSIHDKKTLKEWDNLFNKFMNTKTT